MKEDLIFYAVSRRKWTRLNKNGYFQPENFEEEKEIKCALPQNLQEYLNANFKGRKNLLLLVIDVTRLATSMQKKKHEGYVYLSNPINIDAILDKIRLDCNEKGEFDLSVKSFT